MFFNRSQDNIGGKKDKGGDPKQTYKHCGRDFKSEENARKNRDYGRKKPHHQEYAVYTFGADKWFLVFFTGQGEGLPHKDDYYRRICEDRRHSSQHHQKEGHHTEEPSRGRTLFGLGVPAQITLVAVGILLEHHQARGIDKKHIGERGRAYQESQYEINCIHLKKSEG